MQANKATAKSQGPQRAVPCFGRGKEAETFLRLHQEASAGTGSFILLNGRSGIGKSTLLAEVQHRVRDLGSMVLVGQCRPGLPSYHPLMALGRQALGHLAERSTSVGQLTRWERMLDVFQGRSGHWLEGRDPSTARIHLFDQFAQMLTVLSRVRPVMVLVSDLEFADPGTLDLLRFLGRVLTPRPELSQGTFRGMLVASSAQEQQQPALTALGQASEEMCLQVIQLDALDNDGVRDFLSSDVVIDKVRQLTGGVPRNMDRLLFESLMEQDQAATEEPSPLQGLGDAAVQLMELLAVAGRPLGPDTVCELSDLPQEQLSRAIARLADRRLVDKAAVDGEIRLGIARAGDQREIYQQLEPRRRAALHAGMATYLQQRGDAELESRAEHLLLSGPELGGEQAVHVALAAGQRLEIACSAERAADLYQRALPLTDDPALREQLTERLSELHEQSGQLDQALASVELLRELRPDDPEVTLRAAQIQLLKSDYVAARRELEALHPQLDQGGLLAARILAAQAEAQLMAGQTNQAYRTAEQGLACASGADDAAGLLEQTLAQVRLRNTLGKVHLDRGEAVQAGELFQQNLDTAQAAERRPEELRAMAQLGLTALKQDDYTQAEAWYQRARTMAEAVGEHRLLGVCLQHLGVLAERRRDYGRALELYQDAVAVLKKTGHRSYLAWVALDLSKLYVELGDLSRASAMVQLASRLADGEQPLATRINLQLVQGKIAQQRCRFREAGEKLSRAVDLAQGAGQEERLARGLLELASLELERGEYREALRLVKERVGAQSNRSLHLRALVLAGQIQLELDRQEGARVDLAEALELNEELGDPEVAWQARYLMSRVAGRQRRMAEARRWLREAGSAEERARAGVPVEFRELLAEQPLRAELRHELDSTGPTLRRKVAAAAQGRGKASWRGRYAAIVGEHERLLQILHHVDRVAPTDTTVLVRGESGTGKELVARAIQQRSARADKTLVTVNCGALVESLLLSELFGHERGAFTGASHCKKGRFEVADGGTIFLDEIGDVSPRTQAALLRVLQEQEFERVGGTRTISVNVRIICATNRDLEQMVARGEFREDLYYRLRGVQLHLPPLRDRLADVPLLAEHFLCRIAAERDQQPWDLTPEATRLLQAYGWPGNVRELENVLRSVSLLADGQILDVEDFLEYPELATVAQQVLQTHEATPQHEQPDDADALDGPAGALGPYREVRDLGLSLKEYKTRIERECIREALAEAGGNITRAAKLLGMKRPRLSQLIKEHDLVAR